MRSINFCCLIAHLFICSSCFSLDIGTCSSDLKGDLISFAVGTRTDDTNLIAWVLVEVWASRLVVSEILVS